MFRGWTLILTAATLLASGAFVGGTIVSRSAANGKEVVELPAPVARIAYVNIAKVLREYQRGIQWAKSLAHKQKAFADQADSMRSEKEKLAQTLACETDEKEKIQTKGKITAIARKIEDLEITAQRELLAMSDKIIVDTYHDIEICVAKLAKERSLDAVEAYPAAEPVNAVITAEKVLRTPACYPIYLRKEFDTTKEIIRRLNQKHPSEK